MKKISAVMICAISLVQAKAYVGILGQGSFIKANEKFLGVDEEIFSTYDFSQLFNPKLNNIGVGGLLGYESKMKFFKASLEIDALIFGDIANRNNMITDDGNGNIGGLKESFFVSKNEFGLTPSFSIPASKNFDFFFGVRANASRYDLRVKSNFSNSDASKNDWVFAAEPHLGIKINADDHAAFRFSVGYNIVQNKTLELSNYVDASHAPVQASYTFKQNSGLVIRGSLIFSF